jgi:hypothetical protein
MMLATPIRTLACALCVALIAGCGLPTDVPPAATTEGDAVATQVAIAQAVAATLTAAVPAETSEPDEPTPTLEDTAVEAEEPSVTPEPPPEPPTAEPPTAEPPTAEPPTAEPTEIPDQPLPRAYAPGGNSDNVLGGIVVPDDARIASYSEGNDLEVVFGPSVWFSVQAYVPSGDGNDSDGAGIAEVRISITGPSTSGETIVIHERTERTASFCVFGGGEPDCEVWDFAANGAWPNGEPVQFGENYHVQINIDGADGDSGASWNFNFTIEAPE